MNPLAQASSLKVKLGALVGISVLLATVVATIGVSSRVTPWLVIPVTVAVAMLVTQWLAAGMTAPLRAMTAAAGRMARGDYATTVSAAGRDEVAELARAFNAMSAELRDVDQHRRELVATVSHELRTPAAALRAILENMADGVAPMDEPGLRTALGQAERLSELLTDLLALSRIDAGLVALRLEPVVVRDLLEEVVGDLVLAGRSTPVEIAVTPANLTITAERARLRQAVTNLIDNAARHTASGTSVQVGAVRRGAEWDLDVTDSGPGIAPGDREGVFERYGTASAGGTGLGLAVTRWVAEIHGGRVAAIDPDPGRRGARLRLTLPVQPALRSPRAPLASTDSPTPATTSVQATIGPSTTDHRTTGHRATAPPTTDASTADPSTDDASTTGPSAANHSTADHPGASMTAPPARPLPPAYGPLPPNRPTPPPVIDSLFGSLWPDAGVRGRPRLLIAALATGLFAAIALPQRNFGLASTLVLLAAGATIAASAPRRRWTALYLALAVGLAFVPMLRAAGWLSVLALMAGATLVVAALAPVGSILGLVATASAWPLAGLRGLPWLGRMLALPRRDRRQWSPVVRTALLSVLALVIFGGLFASADAIFGRWVGALIPDLSADTIVQRVFILLAVAGITLAAVYLATNPLRAGALHARAPKPVQRAWEWVIPVAFVVLMYAGFLLAQASAWLRGHDFVQRTTGLTYADYVHQGFGQLTLASLLTVAVVALTARKARHTKAADRLLLRALLGTLCVLTLLVIASAVWRMHLYQQAYGFTALRLVVDAFELWVGLVVAMLLVAGIRLSGTWIPRTAVATGAAVILGLAVLNPDAYVVNANLDRYQSTGKLDAYYLTRLSADAVPAMSARLSGTDRACLLVPGDQVDDRHQPDDFLSFNLGRYRAAGIVPREPVSTIDFDCTPVRSN